MTHQNRNRFTPEIETLESREVPSTLVYSTANYSYYDVDSDPDAYKVRESMYRSASQDNLKNLALACINY